MRIVFYILLFVILFAITTIFLGGCIFSAPRYSGAPVKNFDGREFINPGNVETRGFKELLSWLTNRERGEWTPRLDLPYGEKPLTQVDSGIRITFINHSTFLIQVDGINILTDPVWSNRVGPTSWLGPKRMRPPGIRFEDLPVIHYVLISHNHYDHLDINTLKDISQNHKATVLTPPGVKAYLDKKKTGVVEDMNWWDEKTTSGKVQIQCVPAQHFSGRGLFDRNGTLWCGFVIKSPSGNIYFGGDTGYNEQTFKEIGQRAGKIKIALIPIGAYKPEWFMKPVHVTPEEAIKIHLDLEAQQSIGIHFGTFEQADDGQFEPIHDLKIAMKKHGLDENDFLVLEEGVAKDF
jgi:L-ascorbate metabolism protein UlaG (beta-lactamase superfamily)